MPGPSEFMVGNAPGGANYAPQLMPFIGAQIGNLPDTYMQGLRSKQEMEWMKPVLGPDGQPTTDLNTIQMELMRRGGGAAAQNYMQAMLPYVMGAQMGESAARGLSGGGFAPSAPATAPEPPPERPPSNNHPAGAGPSNIDPSIRPQPQAGNTTPITEGAGSRQGPTVRAIARGAGDESMIADLARTLRVGPDTQLSNEQAQKAADYVRLKQRGTQLATASSEDISQPTKPVSALESNMQPALTAPQGTGGAPAPVIGARETTPPLPSGIQPYGAPPGQPGGPPVPAPAQPQAQPPAQVAQAAPAQGTAQPTPGPLTGSLPPGYTEQAANALEARGNAKLAAASKVAFMPKGGTEAAANYKASAEQDFAQAKAIRDAIAKQQEYTPEEKTAARQGMTPQQVKAQEAQTAEDIKTYQKLNTGIQALANTGVSMIPTLDAATSLLNAGAATGWAGDKIQTAKQILARFGGDPQGAMTLEAFGKQMSAFINQQTNNLKAEGMEMGGTSMRLFQAQISNMQKASPSPDYTPAGNRYLIEVYRRGVQRAVEIADRATAYAKANGGRLDAQFEQQMRDWQIQNPMFDAKEMSDPRLVAAPNVPSQIQTKAQLKAWEKTVGLQSGDAIRVGPGQYKKVQ